MAPRTKKAAAAPVAPVSTSDNDASSQHDVTMDEAPPSSAAAGAGTSQENGAAGANDDDMPILDRQMIRILPGSSETAASFEFTGEDHTLGNALRYIIMKNPDVEFCGYSIPHPSEPKMNVRIQTYEGTTAFDALEKGLDDLMNLCDVVADKFTVARNEFMEKVSS